MAAVASLFNFILAHQGDSADPELLHWIKERLDSIFGSGPWVVVGIMGFFILAIPVFVGIVYLMQSGRRAAAESAMNLDGTEQERIP